MAMTNAQIICTEMLKHGLDIEKMRVDTYIGWRRKGYIIKRGEKAVFTTYIWKPCHKKHAENTEESQALNENSYDYMMLVKAAFFTNEQVQKEIKPND